MKDILKINKLISLLKKVTIICDNFSGEYLHYFHSPIEFKNDINISITNLQSKKFNDLNNIYNSFHIDSEWYDLTGIEGKEIGTKIFNLVKNVINGFESQDILKLINDFIATANEGVQIFKKKYGISDLLEGWNSKVYEQKGKLNDLGIVFYAFHGCGLLIHFRNKSVDFDFLYLAKNEIRHDGFDLLRLHSFAEGQPTIYNKFLDISNLKKDFFNLLENNVICHAFEQDNHSEQYVLTTSINN